MALVEQCVFMIPPASLFPYLMDDLAVQIHEDSEWFSVYLFAPGIGFESDTNDNPG